MTHFWSLNQYNAVAVERNFGPCFPVPPRRVRVRGSTQQRGDSPVAVLTSSVHSYRENSTLWVEFSFFFRTRPLPRATSLEGLIQQSRFRWRRVCSNRPIFYVIYYIENSGGFTESYFRPSWTVTPILETLDRHVRCCGFDNNLTTSSTHCVICFLMHICVCTSYYHDVVVGLRTQFFTLLELRGLGGMGIRMLTLDTKTSLFVEDRDLK